MSTCAEQLPSLALVDSGAVENESTRIREAVVRNAAALELLLANDRGRLYRSAFTILRNREDAEDALQDGLQRAFSRLHTFEGRSMFSSWVTRIVINSALMILRRRRRRTKYSVNEIMENQAESAIEPLPDKHPNPEQIYAFTELYERIERRLLGFPAIEQVAFRHYVIDGHSTDECCEMFGVSASTFKSRITRTRHKLARGLNRLPRKAVVVSSKEKGTAGDQCQ